MKILFLAIFAVVLFAGLAVVGRGLLCGVAGDGYLSEVKHLLSSGE